MEDFLASLHREIDLRAEYGTKTTFETIFFGGGTPSLLTPRQLETILSHLNRVFPIDPSAEVTVETNPGTVSKEKLAEFRSLGINRLSIGIQSFEETDLQFLTRIHNVQQGLECYRHAREVGFENVSIDLIYALPDQSKAQWLLNLERAVALEPNHISAYGLIVEDNTPLARLVSSKLIAPKPPDEEAEFFELTMEFLEAHGFEHYEVSNYAKPGFRSRHNYNYWRHENYLGFGPSAHSFWNENNTARRWFNIPNLSHYCADLREGTLPTQREEILTKQQLVTEQVFLGLRSDGLRVSEIESAFSAPQQSVVRELVQRGAAQHEDGLLRLTRQGYLLCDEIAARLIP